MKTLLAAVEQDSDEIRLTPPARHPLHKAAAWINTAATLGALQLALADMAIDLSALDERPARR